MTQHVSIKIPDLGQGYELIISPDAFMIRTLKEENVKDWSFETDITQLNSDWKAIVISNLTEIEEATDKFCICGHLYAVHGKNGHRCFSCDTCSMFTLDRRDEQDG